MKFKPSSNKSIPFDGAYSGLRSTSGYERYDGVPLASATTVDFNADGTISGELVGDYYEGEQDRVDARDLIIPPNATDTPILAVFEYADMLWCIKDLSGYHKLYRCPLDGSESVGWRATSVTAMGGPFVGPPDTPNGNYNVAMGRIQELYGNDEVVILCNGLESPWVLHYASSTVTLTKITHANLPLDPWPKLSIIWNQRLFLGYEKGNLFFSATGLNVLTDADAWNPSVAPAGQLYYEDELTNLIVAPSALVVFCENQTNVLKKATVDISTGVDFIGDTYSPTSGAIWATAQRILGTILFCNDRGISTLATTAAFGDFSANSISKSAQNTYLSIKDSIISASVNRSNNQYKVITPNGGLCVTFKGKDELKGITAFAHPDEISCVYESSWIGGAGGLVYKWWDGAASFDCEVMEGLVRTSYFTYNSPSRWKQFKRILFELQASKGTAILITNNYDYSSASSPKALTDTVDTSGFLIGSAWGTADWGSFIWGGSVEAQAYIYISGTGTNMSIGMRSQDKYHEPIIFHNAQVTYTQGNMDF